MVVNTYLIGKRNQTGGGMASGGGGKKDDDKSAKRAHIVYVHGTFAQGETDKHTDQQSDHAFMEALGQRYNATVEPHVWNGSHLDSERRVESTRLAQHLTELHASDPERPLHVFAHSHGGNVLGHALQKMPEGSRITSAHLLGTPVQSGPSSWNHNALDHVSDRVTNYFSNNDPVQTTGADLFNRTRDNSATKPAQMGQTRLLHESEGAHGTPRVNNVDLSAFTGYPPTAHSDLHSPHALQGFPPTLPTQTQRQRTTGWAFIDAPPPTARVFPALNEPVSQPAPTAPMGGPKLKKS
jgi:hypothetical protein